MKVREINDRADSWKLWAVAGAVVAVTCLYILCFLPGASSLLYGDDYCLISAAIDLYRNRPSDLLALSTYRNFFRPLLFGIYYVCFRVFGFHYFAYHALSVFIHLSVAVSMFLLAATMSKPASKEAWLTLGLVALYFFSHFQVHQAVYWFLGIKQMLCSLLGLGGFYFALRWSSGKGSWKTLFAPIAMIGTGFLMIESIAGYSVIIPLAALLWPDSERRFKERVLGAAILSIPFIAYSSLFIAFRSISSEGQQLQVFWKPLSLYPASAWTMFLRSFYPHHPDLAELNLLYRTLEGIQPALLAAAAIFFVGAAWWRFGIRALLLCLLYLSLVAPYAAVYNPTIADDRIYYESVTALCLSLGFFSVTVVNSCGRRKNTATALLSLLLLAGIVLNVVCYRRELVPAYRDVEEWNARVQRLFTNDLSAGTDGDRRLYWIGTPFYAGNVMPVAGCFSAAANLHSGTTVFGEDELSALYRLDFKGRTIYLKSEFFQPPTQGDVIVFDDGQSLRLLSPEEAEHIIAEISSRP